MLEITAHGTVLEGPSPVDAEHPEFAHVAFVLGTTQPLQHGGERLQASAPEQSCIVTCHEPALAAAVVDQLDPGQPVIVTGTLCLVTPVTALVADDGPLVRLTLSARSIGLDLAPATL